MYQKFINLHIKSLISLRIWEKEKRKKKNYSVKLRNSLKDGKSFSFSSVWISFKHAPAIPIPHKIAI